MLDGYRLRRFSTTVSPESLGYGRLPFSDDLRQGRLRSSDPQRFLERIFRGHGLFHDPDVFRAE